MFDALTDVIIDSLGCDFQFAFYCFIYIDT